MHKRYYRVLIEYVSGGLEQGLNELAEQGFRPILMTMSETRELAVIMERQTEEQAG